MALSYVKYTADGTTPNFALTFPYLNKSHVSATKNGATVAFTWLAASIVAITGGVVDGDEIKVTRITPKTPLVDSNDGAVLTNSVLRTLALQAIYLSEEAQDAANDANAAAQAVIGIATAAAEAAAEDAEEASVDADAAAASAASAAASAAIISAQSSISMADVSAFRAMVPNPLAVTLKGSFGSGGLFILDGSDTVSPDDGVLTIVNSTGKRYKRNFIPGEFYAAWWGVVGDGVTACDIALKNAAVAAAGGVLILPRGRVLLNGSATVHLVNICLRGMGALNWSNADTPDYPGYQQLGNFGTTFLLTSTSVQPFTIDNSVTIEHCNFYWPNQTGLDANPIVYPPLLTDRGVNFDNTGGVANNAFINCSVINAYDFLKQSTQSLTWGSWRVLFSDIYAIRRTFSLASVAEQFMVVGCVFNPSLYFEGASASVFTGGISNGSGGSGNILNVTHVNSGHIGVGYRSIGGGPSLGTTVVGLGTGTGLTGTYTVSPSQFVAPGTEMFFGANLVKWTRDNGAWLHVWGNGTHSQAGSTLVGGFAATNNIVYGYRRGVHIETGCLDFATFDPSHHFDGIPQVLYCGPAGSVTHTRFLGTYYSFKESGDASNLACFELDDPAASGPTGGSNIEVSGDLRGGNGTFFQASGANINRIEITKVSVGNWGGSSTVDNYYAVYVSAANADVRISASNMFTGQSGGKARGIYVPSSKSLLIDGVKIRGSYSPIDVTGNTGPVFITGVQTVGTTGTYSTAGTLGDNVTFGVNDFDKSYSYLDGTFRFGNGLAMYLASQGAGVGASPYAGFNLWQKPNGDWVWGKGSGGSHYGALLRLDASGGNLGFFMTSTGGAAGSTATIVQHMYLSASDGTIYQARPVRALSSFRAQGVGTTASGGNAFLDSGDANNLLRSTSSVVYKTAIEPLDSDVADRVINEAEPIWYHSTAPADRPDWSWYGLSAEAMAAIEPRLVHFGYQDDDYEIVEVEPESSFDIELENGETITAVKPAVTDRRLKAGAVKKPDGIMYDRITVMLLDVVRRQGERIAALEAAAST